MIFVHYFFSFPNIKKKINLGLFKLILKLKIVFFSPYFVHNQVNFGGAVKIKKKGNCRELNCLKKYQIINFQVKSDSVA